MFIYNIIVWCHLSFVVRSYILGWVNDKVGNLVSNIYSLFEQTVEPEDSYLLKDSWL